MNEILQTPITLPPILRVAAGEDRFGERQDGKAQSLRRAVQMAGGDDETRPRRALPTNLPHKVWACGRRGQSQ